MPASCCGSSRKTAALVVVAAALTGVALGLVMSPRFVPRSEPSARSNEELVPLEETVATEEKKNALWASLSERGTVTIPNLVWYKVKAIQPESYVDVVAWFDDGRTSEAFWLLQNVRVIAIDEDQELISPPGGTRPSSATAWLAADERGETLVAFAVLLNSTFELVPRRPGDPRSAWDYDATLARLQRLAKEAAAPEPEVAPFPRAVP